MSRECSTTCQYMYHIDEICLLPVRYIYLLSAKFNNRSWMSEGTYVLVCMYLYLYKYESRSRVRTSTYHKEKDSPSLSPSRRFGGAMP